MSPQEALDLLGSKRVIWIDDQFETDNSEKLARLLAEHLESSRNLGLQELEPILDRIEYGDDNAHVDLVEILNSVGLAKRKEISSQLHSNLVKNEGDNDLNEGQIASIQKQLNIKLEDCWSFDQADHALNAKDQNADNDSHITYIIDLNDDYGALGNERGLELLQLLGNRKSEATVFLLTHEATKATEADVEHRLSEKLGDGDVLSSDSPICVIAKERLEDERSAVIAEGLKVAIKRAGLRRGIHEVLLRANNELNTAFGRARQQLLKIPPEQLDHYIVKQAYKEGVSELHVVERALSASMSESFRTLFATDPTVISGANRFRKLRPIVLDTPESVSPALQTFRRIELWENDTLVNASHSLLACGDVFVATGSDPSTLIPSQRFILLTQPCDVMLRNNGNRDFDTGILVQISPRDPNDKSVPSLKKPLLPFVLDMQEWVCEFRKSAVVSLAILDCATWRVDGKVQYEYADAESFSPMLLPGQQKNANRIAKRLEQALTQRAKLETDAPEWFMPCCLLTLSSDRVFQEFATPKFVAKNIAAQKKNAPPTLAGSFSWGLQRIGRVRMPYAASMLNNYLAVQGREAFEIDYLKITEQPCVSEDKASDGAASEDREDREDQQQILPNSALTSGTAFAPSWTSALAFLRHVIRPRQGA